MLKYKIQLFFANHFGSTNGFWEEFKEHWPIMSYAVFYVLAMIIKIHGAFVRFPLHKPSTLKESAGMHIVPLWSWMRWEDVVWAFALLTVAGFIIFIFDVRRQYEPGSDERRPYNILLAIMLVIIAVFFMAYGFMNRMSY